MSKSILVINTPKSCNECILYCIGISVCNASIKRVKNENDKPDWCPLKKFPERKKLRDFVPLKNDIFMEGMKAEGWNACLDEILKAGKSK